jgi:hypothetical protein
MNRYRYVGHRFRDRVDLVSVSEWQAHEVKVLFMPTKTRGQIADREEVRADKSLSSLFMVWLFFHG